MTDEVKQALKYYQGAGCRDIQTVLTLADAYLALHTDEKVRERRELIEIFDEAIEVIAGKQTCRRVVAALEAL